MPVGGVQYASTLSAAHRHSCRLPMANATGLANGEASQLTNNAEVAPLRKKAVRHIPRRTRLLLVPRGTPPKLRLTGDP